MLLDMIFKNGSAPHNADTNNISAFEKCKKDTHVLPVYLSNLDMQKVSPYACSDKM